MQIITLSDVKLPIGADEKQLISLARKKLGGAEPKYFSIRKKSLDARDKSNIRWVYSIEFSKQTQRSETPVFLRLPKEKQPKHKVLVVGSGPAGLFCAVRLLEHGVTPILIERGAPVEEREKKIESFFESK